MVTKLSTGKNIKGAITYNEQKVTEGTAELLSANKFLKDKEDLSFKEKVDHFKRYTDQNTKAKTNSFHFSLNFHEKDNLNNQQMTDIADKFMKEIGFDSQPYLAYRHFDSGHPHIHIVSTNIQANGKRINDSMIAKKMRKVATDVEKEYGLTLTGKNLEQENKQYKYPEHDNGIKPVDYPEKNLRNKISDIVAIVHNEYRYKSFKDYNKLLGHYNLKAIKLNGKNPENLDIETFGLAYQSLKNGKEVGTPIYGSELLHLGRFTAARLDNRIASHKASNMSDAIEKDVSRFLKDRITYKPSSLHKHLKEQGYISLDKSNPTSSHTVYLDTKNKTVISLNDIKDKRLKQVMTSKAQSFDMSVKEGKEITEEIKNFWQQKKKENPEKYYLESRMIKDIENISFDPLKNRVGEKHGTDKFDINLESYLKYKKRNFDKTLKKEKGYFKITTLSAWNYTSHLSERDRNVILGAMDIKTEKLGDLTYFEHKKYAELNDVTSLKGDQHAIKTNKLQGDEVKPWDLKLLKYYVLCQKNDFAVNKAVENAVKYRKLPGGYKLLNDNDKQDFLKRFTQQYINQFKWQKRNTLKNFVSEMAGKGILIKQNINGGYTLGLHGFPQDTYHQASDGLTDFLKDNNYQNRTYERVKKVMDEHYKAHKGAQTDDLPESEALLKEKAEKQDASADLKRKLDKLEDLLTMKQNLRNEKYDEATHNLNKKKKRKRKRRILYCKVDIPLILTP